MKNNSYFILCQYAPERLKYVNLEYQLVKGINWKSQLYQKTYLKSEHLV